jgi:type I restriction enzyme S subunit
MTGGTPSRKVPEYFGGNIKWLVSGDIHKQEICDCDGRITEAGVRNSNARLLPINSVMIALNGQGKTRGTVALLRTEATCNQSLVSIYPKDTTRLLPEFLYFNLNGRYEELRRMTSDDDKDRRGLNMGLIRTIEVPLPPLPEQKRIVAKLDEAFEGLATAKANAEKNLKNARAIFESELNEIFTKKGDGWEELPLETDTRFIDYRGKTPIKITEGLRLITAKNVRMGVLQQEPEEFVAPDTYNTWMTRGIPKKGDVLFTTEAPLGFVCQLDTDEKVVFAQRIIILQTNRAVLDPTFLKWAMISSVVQSRIHACATGATAQGIKASLLKRVMIPRAPYAEQKSIVTKCDELSEETGRLGLVYKRKLSDLDALKKSLLNEAFTGNL